MTTSRSLLQTLFDHLEIRGAQPVRSTLCPLAKYLGDLDLPQFEQYLHAHLSLDDPPFARHVYESRDETGDFFTTYGDSPNTIPVSASQADRLLETDTGFVSQWPVLTQHYPNAIGLLDVGWPFWNDRLTNAVVYLGVSRGPKNGSGHLYLLSSANSVWEVTASVRLWVS